MDTRKVTLIATIAVIALLAVGIGYAYTASTSNTGNDVDAEYIQIKLYAENGTTPAYTGTTTNVQFNTKTTETSNVVSVNYGVDNNTQLTNVKKISLQAFNKNNAAKNVQTLTMTSSVSIFDATKGYTDDEFTVTLTETVAQNPKTWTGVKSGDTWTFTSTSGNVITAGTTETMYILTFQINDSGDNYPFSEALPRTTFDLNFVATEGTPAGP